MYSEDIFLFGLMIVTDDYGYVRTVCVLQEFSYEATNNISYEDAHALQVGISTILIYSSCFDINYAEAMYLAGDLVGNHSDKQIGNYHFSDITGKDSLGIMMMFSVYK